jgi:hypothetical protein
VHCIIQWILFCILQGNFIRNKLGGWSCTKKIKALIQFLSRAHVSRNQVSSYATKTTNTSRNTTNTKKILMMSHRLEEMLFRYLRSCPCAPSTFAKVSSMFSSILQTIQRGQQDAQTMAPGILLKPWLPIEQTWHTQICTTKAHCFSDVMHLQSIFQGQYLQPTDEKWTIPESKPSHSLTKSQNLS